MALDGVFLNCLKNEFKNTLIGARIDKIHQPEKDELHIVLRGYKEVYKLLISASSNHPRIYLYKGQKTNPYNPPLFCMILRKHISNGRIIDIKQIELDRVLVFKIDSKNELGDITRKNLIIEIMGRHSNIILTDDNNIIIDSIKRIPSSISRVRQVLPGIPYENPPSQKKISPLSNDAQMLLNNFPYPLDYTLASRLIFKNFMGLSKITAEEIAFRSLNTDANNNIHSLIDEDMLTEAFKDFFTKLKTDISPNILFDKNLRPIDVFPLCFYHLSKEDQKQYDSLSYALEIFFESRDTLDRNRQRTSELTKFLQTRLKRAENKIEVLLNELEEAENVDSYRLFGEILTSNLHRISRGQSVVTLQNYYEDNDSYIEIKLDKNKSPSENAQSYYKLYNKAKNALIILNKQIKQTKDEIVYIESQLDNLEKCTEEIEIQEIRLELEKEGYLKPRNKNKKTVSKGKSKPYSFISSDGFQILVGKNNLQNDDLTLKIAKADDIWLHAKEIPGSHVIIKNTGKEIPENTIQEAAMLAAYFSKTRGLIKTPIDYCPKRNVRKPKGSKPGMVIYDNYNTIYIESDEKKINSLKKSIG